MHLWHDLKRGKDYPHSFTSVIEIPKGSNVKYELDKETGLIMVDRMLYSAMVYPLNYGFIPRTYCEDKDPIDVLLLGEAPLVPGCLVESRPVGFIYMRDGGEEDAKILAVPSGDPELAHVKTLADVSPHLISKIENFFATYKILQKKSISDIKTQDLPEALKMLEQAATDYDKQSF